MYEIGVEGWLNPKGAVDYGGRYKQLNELLLAACRNDQDDVVNDIIQSPDSVDLNFTDGVGNSALHYCAMYGGLNCLEILAEQDGINVNLQNRIEGNTALHLAVQYKDDPDVGLAIVETLLEFDGINLQVQNKNGQTPMDLVDKGNEDMLELLRGAIAAGEVNDSDIPDDDDDEDEDEDDEPSDED
ncbi:hypothetical protein BZG36_05006 [Bifiguratus adelaidae]|uniref:Uncharacterized protein n=1 Tax=Bifiguratus adelaidae TaxID=1938954 RepID=A0A261XU84_9FUNG|nr:hypothetical protein BZG36_05006 [Bifiguratus adelaidae]